MRVTRCQRRQRSPPGDRSNNTLDSLCVMFSILHSQVRDGGWLSGSGIGVRSCISHVRGFGVRSCVHAPDVALRHRSPREISVRSCIATSPPLGIVGMRSVVRWFGVRSCIPTRLWCPVDESCVIARPDTGVGSWRNSVTVWAVASVLVTRPLRVLYPGAVYHVVARGNERQRIFRDVDRLPRDS